jgi:GT2 family glycosyltransferase
MNMNVYPLHNRAVPIDCSRRERDWIQEHEPVYASLPLDSANDKGWVLQCPHAFEATWNGGPDAQDIDIRFDDAQSPIPSFVQSHLGGGLLTLYSGYQCKTEHEVVLWIRGPINSPKDGLCPLEQIVDTSILPCTISIYWKFTRPHHTVRFEAGEPFCTLLPYAKKDIGNVAEEVLEVEENLSALEQDFQQMIQDPAVLRVLQKLSADGAATHAESGATPLQNVDQPDQGKRPDDEVLFLPPLELLPSPEPMAQDVIQTLFKQTYPVHISVILAASNESVLLQRTVEQFEATLPANSEIIVVDDGSTDGCTDFLADRERDHVDLRRVLEPLGISGARNYGFSQARGEVVVFADAHIDLPRHWWQPLVATLNRPHVGVVSPGIGVMGKPRLPAAFGQRIVEANFDVEWLFRQPEVPCPVPTLGNSFLALSHDTLKQAGTFDPCISQGSVAAVELCLRYWLLGYEVWVVPTVTIQHYFRKTHAEQMTEENVASHVLRTAFLHFNRRRIAQVVAALKHKPGFDQALASAAGSDVWEQSAAFATRRVRDDDWFFTRFGDSEGMRGHAVDK